MTFLKKLLLVVFVATALTALIATNLKNLSVSAQTTPPGPIPSPTPFPCNATSNTEYDSLRPYQASPCQATVSKSASFCGNNLILHSTVTGTYPGNGTCTELNGKVTCTFSQSVNIPNVAINLANATLPFLGNTQNVPNSQPPPSTPPLSDADKVNGYVSWYLNGVQNRAENGSSENNNDTAVNYSGPINKLLPGPVLDAQRIQTISNVAAGTNHNQIVACGQNQLGIIGDIFGLGSLSPTPCYNNDGTPAPVHPTDSVLRLNSWKGALSPLNNVANGINTVANQITKLVTPDLYPYIQPSLKGIWNQKVPPLPSEKDPNGIPFTTLTYQKAYNEWKGETCVIVPVINYLVCFNNILIPNRYADLYSYIPLSSTEDVTGNISVNSASAGSQTAGVSVTGVSFTGQTPAELFYPHVEETNQLGSLLQSTFISKDLNPSAGAASAPSDVACVSTDVRTNAGDNLFAKQIMGDLKYNAQFSCNFNPIINSVDPICLSKCLANGDPRDICNAICATTQPTQSCTKDVYVTLTTESSSPGLDQLWSTLVAGPTSIFRRLAPQIGANGPVACILDIPGSTNISYQGGGVNTDATLNLPHLGGISAYFLDGIQTMLRPKGYGSELPSTNNTSLCINASNTASTDICSANCNNNPSTTDISGLKAKFTDLATRWLGAGNPRIDKFDEVVSAAQSAGVDPIFTLAIWLNESGASNYQGICLTAGNSDPNSEYCQQVQDFGVNDQNIKTQYDVNGNIKADHFEDQLHAFLNLPAYYLQTCTGNSTAKCSMEIFGAMFKPGQCNPTDNSNAYISGIEQIYKWLQPSQNIACYPIKVPGK